MDKSLECTISSLRCQTVEGGPGRHAHPLRCLPSSSEQQPLKRGEMVGGAQQNNVGWHFPQISTVLSSTGGHRGGRGRGGGRRGGGGRVQGGEWECGILMLAQSDENWFPFTQ